MWERYCLGEEAEEGSVNLGRKDNWESLQSLSPMFLLNFFLKKIIEIAHFFNKSNNTMV